MGSCRALQGKGQDAKEARSSCRKKTGQSGEASLEQGRVGGGPWEMGVWEHGFQLKAHWPGFPESCGGALHSWGIQAEAESCRGDLGIR